MMQTLLGVFVSPAKSMSVNRKTQKVEKIPVIPQPHIVTILHQDEGQSSQRVGETNPDFAIHEEAMMQIDNRLPSAGTRTPLLLSFAGWQSVESK